MKYTCNEIHYNPEYHETVDLQVRYSDSTEDTMVNISCLDYRSGKVQRSDAELKF